jgi:hypothetical protein
VSRLNQLKLGLALIGLIVWGYGARIDHNGLQWAGIGFLAAAAVLRFMKRRDEKPPEVD